MLRQIVFAAGVAIVYAVGLAIYRLFFHPLAKFPGPKLAAATGWYEAYFDLFVQPGGQFMHQLKRLHEEYGPIVRINPHEIHVNDFAWASTLYTGPGKVSKDCLLEKFISKAVSRSAISTPPAAHILGLPKGMAGTIPHERHQMRRGAVASLFSKKALLEAEYIIHDCMEKLLRRIDMQIKQDGFAEMRLNLFALTTTIVDDYCVGLKMSLLDDGKETAAKEWLEGIGAVTENAPLARQWGWITPLALSAPPWLVKALSPEFGRVVQWHRSVKAHAENVTRATLAENEMSEKKEDIADDGTLKIGTHEQHNVFKLILQNPDLPPEDKLCSRMSQEGNVMIGAGGETSASVMKSTLFHALAAGPELLSPLRDELKTVMPDSTTRPPLRELEKLPLLTAVLKEGLRIVGVVASRSPLVSPNEDLVYKDWVIPAGTPVSMTYRHALHEPSVYEDPYEFRPQRWFTTDADKLMRMNRNFIPFGKGTRMCLAFQLAWAELYITLAYILRREDLVLHESTSGLDVDTVSDCMVVQVSPKSTGMKITSTAIQKSE